jgi:hypothetical protein
MFCYRGVVPRQRVGSEICFELTSAVPLRWRSPCPAISFQSIFHPMATKTCPTSLPAMDPWVYPSNSNYSIHPRPNSRKKCSHQKDVRFQASSTGISCTKSRATAAVQSCPTTPARSHRIRGTSTRCSVEADTARQAVHARRICGRAVGHLHQLNERCINATSTRTRCVVPTHPSPCYHSTVEVMQVDHQ